MKSAARLAKLLQQLTGEPAPLEGKDIEQPARFLVDGRGLGLSQLNEILLLLGYDRISAPFFQYLVDRSTVYTPGACLASFRQLSRAVRDFQELALLNFGNVKYAFKILSKDPEQLEEWVVQMSPISVGDFRQRHEPVLPTREIPPESTYLLGYLIEEEIKDRLNRNPDDEDAIAMESERKNVVEDGQANQRAYLASDHLDVYVATSMRQRHEFMFVSRVTREIFSQKPVRDLKLRWFDPTQAYCADRIDKGLSEALMLKRAKCTIYLAQESETLGKDSELASTLAQGKPVVAFVPYGGPDFVDQLLSDLRVARPGTADVELLLGQLKAFNADLAWSDQQVRGWLSNPGLAPFEEVRSRLVAEVKACYDKRARTLSETHPLGIQVNLDSGVANGVLVTRTVEACAKLIRRIVTRTMKFKLEEVARGTAEGYILLRETTSGSVFRVITGNKMLTNAFWNFYLLPEA